MGRTKRGFYSVGAGHPSAAAAIRRIENRHKATERRQAAVVSLRAAALVILPAAACAVAFALLFLGLL